MNKEKKARSTTLAKRNALRLAKNSLHVAKYGAPVVPVAIETGLNWDEWFNNSDGIHVAGGFIMLIVSTLLTYIAIAKKKKVFEKISAFWNVTIIVICWATSLLLLSSILHQIGFILLFIGFSLAASAIMDETETRAVDSSLNFYQELVDKNKLDVRAERKKAKREERRRLAEEEAARESRKVDML